MRPRALPCALMSTSDRFDAARARGFVRLALSNVQAEYPFHLAHFARNPSDLGGPRDLHPLFGASYDWHSCVHMHWTLVRCRRRFPSLAEADAIDAHFDRQFTQPRVAGEIAYLETPGRAAFERPYGWAWLLVLQAELRRIAQEHPPARTWHDTLAPLAELLLRRLMAFLPRQAYPVRAGTHGNSAFALLLALYAADGMDRPELAALVAERAQAWFSADRAYPIEYEPGGDEFLSPGLCEALLMSRVLAPAAFAAWWQGFFPDRARLDPWLTPARVSDPADAKTVHLHGLNLSRAWCWRSLRADLPPGLAPAIDRAFDAHLRASLDQATDGDYVGTHWLASFALLALDGEAL